MLGGRDCVSIGSFAVARLHASQGHCLDGDTPDKAGDMAFRIHSECIGRCLRVPRNKELLERDDTSNVPPKQLGNL